MEFYIITYGLCQIEEIYAGETELAVIQAARPMINQWSEYRNMKDEEIRELAKNGKTEFDLVKIPEAYCDNYDREKLIKIYNQYRNGNIPQLLQ